MLSKLPYITDKNPECTDKPFLARKRWIAVSPSLLLLRSKLQYSDKNYLNFQVYTKKQGTSTLFYI